MGMLAFDGMSGPSSAPSQFSESPRHNTGQAMMPPQQQANSYLPQQQPMVNRFQSVSQDSYESGTKSVSPWDGMLMTMHDAAMGLCKQELRNCWEMLTESF